MRLGVAAAAAALAASLPPVGSAGWRPASAGLPPQPNVLSLAIDVSGGGVLYAGLLRQGIHRSTDGGRSWRSVTNFPLLKSEQVMTFAVGILSLHARSDRPGTLLAGTSFAGLLGTTDAGRSWLERNRGLEGRAGGDLGFLFSVDALASSPSRPSLVYAAVRNRGVYRSTTGGRDWRPTGSLPHLDLRALAGHPARPEVVYAGTIGGGVFKTVDAGRTWRAASRGLRNRLVYDLLVHPIRPWVVYAGTAGGVFKSTDGGRRWRRAGRGLDGAIVQDLLVHPARPRTVYAAARGPGVYRSTDGGATWRPLNAGLSTTLVTALAVGPGGRPTLYAATLGGVFARPAR